MSQSEPVEQPSTKAPSYGSVEIGSDVPAAVDRKSALSRHARIAKLATLYRMRLTPSLINRIQSVREVIIAVLTVVGKIFF